MTFKLTVEMDNSVFFDDDSEEARRNREVARILHELAGRVENSWEVEDGHKFLIRDANGNKVGWAEVTEDKTAVV